MRFASHPVAGNAANDPTSLPAYRAVAEYLMAQDQTPALIGREWIIEDIDGAGVIDGSPASLLFQEDGRLAGNATCNRLIGTFETDGDTLTLSPAGTTMMACPPALEEQERRLLSLLEAVARFRFEADGALILQTANGESITARRR